MKTTKTKTMISAALVIVRALLARPPATDVSVSPVAEKRSRMRLSRKISAIIPLT